MGMIKIIVDMCEVCQKIQYVIKKNSYEKEKVTITSPTVLVDTEPRVDQELGRR